MALPTHTRAVTGENVAEYIARVADFRLNVEPKSAVTAFLRGFHQLVSGRAVWWIAPWRSM